MSHSRIFDQLRAIARIARTADRLGCTPDDARGELAAGRERALSRRALLAGVGAAAAAGASSWRPSVARAAPPVRAGARVAIVGAGLAGLACADDLARRGVAARVFEAHPLRVGGRVLTDRATFPNQVAEAGGEMIDTTHTTMLRLAREFGLAREDYERAPGAARYYFFGASHTEDEVVAQYRALVARMRPDVQSLSHQPDATSFTAADSALDQTDLQSYLEARAGDLPLIREVLFQAYIAEYGVEPREQSCLNFLQFIHLDRRSHFSEFGVFSDERYHLSGGNDALAAALAARAVAGGASVERGARLTRLARTASGPYALYFNGGATPELADVVVLAVPFSVLRGVTLDASLAIPAAKRNAIDALGYGNNVKTMVRFDRRVWADAGFSGLTYADLDDLQNTWETNYHAAARGPGGILTDYGGGDRGVSLQHNPSGTFGCGGCHSGAPTNGVLNPAGQAWVNGQMERFVRDLDQVFPGAAAAASRNPDGSLVGRRGHWLAQQFSRGSYTAYRPGQFTTIAGLEGVAVGALKFAGEHTDSFYDAQGFMEGACNSGLRAAGEVYDDLRARRV